MSAFKKYIPSPLRDPNAWLNRPSGEAHATQAREADGKQADRIRSSRTMRTSCRDWFPR